jgi:urea transporter
MDRGAIRAGLFGFHGVLVGAGLSLSCSLTGTSW